MKISKSDHQAAIERLRELVHPGDTVYTILRHCSRSGMSRVIAPIVTVQRWKIDSCGESEEDGAPYPQDVGYSTAVACGMRYDTKRDGVVVGGCGMDVGGEVVRALGHVLWPEGFTCIGTRCPSNDHSNGDRTYLPHLHLSGGYALTHRWL